MAEPIPMLVTWKGRDIDDLTRAELEEALRWCVAELESRTKQHLSSIRLMRDLHRASHG